MKNMNMKKVGAIALTGALILGLGGTMAYFTDRATAQASGTAGTVAIALDNGINLLNEEGMDILNPGDQRDAAFTVTNMGNKSIDVRETVALTVTSEHYDLAFSGDAETQSEFDLYLASDVDLVEGYGYQPKEGAKPLATKTVEGNVIKYVLPEYSLNGNSDEHDEVETIDGVDAFANAGDYVLVFKGETGNEWQDAVITMDLIVEAKQHENTGAGWDIVAQEEITQGSLTQSAVMSETIITDNGAVIGD